MKYYEKPIVLNLTAYQRKILSEIIDGALDAGACKDGLTKLESNALNSIFRRLINPNQKVPSSQKIANEIISEIEERFPDWQSYRDLIDCIDCTLHRKSNGL